jgi:hypothetical protein
MMDSANDHSHLSPKRRFMVESSNQISERAIELAGGGDRESAVNELVRLVGGDVASLELARHALVSRLRRRSNDYAATQGLTLINAAFSEIGWADPVEWQPRKWRIRR